MNKKTILCILLIDLILIGGIAAYLINGNSLKWMKLQTMKEYQALFLDPISEITLRKTVDAVEWVSFDDHDLILKWIDVLNDLEVKRKKRVSKADTEVNGGRSVITVKTDQSTFTFYLRNSSGETMLEMNGCFYSVRNPEQIPFSETYDMAVKRHGIKTPWE